jgi:uncharacterized protein YndB with AHSA1/START domain
MTDQTVPAIPAAAADELSIVREFAAPRDVVWRFFSEPELLARWFGPHSVHVNAAETIIEGFPGGRWDVTMLDNASDERYPVSARLSFFLPPAYLQGEDESDSSYLRVWLEEIDAERTRLTMLQGPFTPEFMEQTRIGWLESFEKVDAILLAGV